MPCYAYSLAKSKCLGYSCYKRWVCVCYVCLWNVMVCNGGLVPYKDAEGVYWRGFHQSSGGSEWQMDHLSHRLSLLFLIPLLLPPFLLSLPLLSPPLPSLPVLAPPPLLLSPPPFLLPLLLRVGLGTGGGALRHLRLQVLGWKEKQVWT